MIFDFMIGSDAFFDFSNRFWFLSTRLLIIHILENEKENEYE